MTRILYIDTSGKFSQILLFDREKMLAVRTTTEANQHAQRIHVHMQEVLEESGLAWQDISAIAVMNGPGSYTGLRIGLASAKGLCYALNIPLILINHFEQLGYSNKGQDKNAAYVLKARSDEYFYKDEKSTDEVQLLSRDQVEDLIAKDRCLFFSSDEELLHDFEKIQLISIAQESVQSYTLQLFDQQQYADLLHSEPFYLKNVFINKINKL